MHRRHGFRGWDTHRLKGGVLASLDGRIAASAWRVSIRLVTAATRRRLTQTDDCLSPNAPRLIVLYDRQTTTRQPRAYRPLLPLAYKHDLLLLPVCRNMSYTSIDCRRRTRATRCLTRIVLHTEVDHAQCDELTKFDRPPSQILST